MPVYAYKALDRQGRQAVGTLPADSRGGAFDQLDAAARVAEAEALTTADAVAGRAK